MREPKSENMIARVLFALFLLFVFSLGVMKPGIPTGFATLTPSDLIFPVLFLVWLIAVSLRRMDIVWHPAYWSFAVYFGALVISTILSSQPRLSVVKLAGEFYLILLPLIVVSIVADLSRLRLTLLAWIAGAAIPMLVGLLGVVLFYFSPAANLLGEITYHYGAVPVGNFPRINSTFVSPSMFCNYLTVSASLVVIARSLNWISGRAALVLISLIAICSAFTVSITIGGIFLAAGLLTWSYLPVGTVRRLALATGLAVAFAFVAISPIALVPTASHRINPPLLGDYSSSRLLVWSDASRRLTENPLFGSGVGTPAASVVYLNSDGTYSLLTDAHNTLLNVGAQSGILGVLGILLVIFFVLRAATTQTRGELNLIRTGLAIAFIAAFLYDGLTGSFENARHLWVLIGLIFAVDKLGGDERRTGQYSPR